MNKQAKIWECQRELDILVASGFAEVDEAATKRWEGQGHAEPMYRWTEAGKEACFRHRFSLPMPWAEDMHFNRTRHCVVCGRDCYRKKVWAHNGAFRCVCMACGAKGHGLQDLS